MPRTSWTILGMALVVTTVTSCSGSGGKNASGTSAVETTVAQPVTTARPVDTSFTGQGSTAFCGLAKTFSDRFANFAAPATPTQLRATFQEAQTAVNQAVTVAPAEIASDMKVLAAAFTELLAALDRVNYDATRLDQTAFKRIQDPEFLTASARLQAYLHNICHSA